MYVVRAENDPEVYSNVNNAIIRKKEKMTKKDPSKNTQIHSHSTYNITHDVRNLKGK